MPVGNCDISGSCLFRDRVVIGEPLCHLTFELEKRRQLTVDSYRQFEFIAILANQGLAYFRGESDIANKRYIEVAVEKEGGESTQAQLYRDLSIREGNSMADCKGSL